MATAEALATADLPEWEELAALTTLIDGPPPDPAEDGDLPTPAAPDWESLDQLARILRFRLEPAREVPCPVDLTRTYIVRFLNQTANKPLHLGHLRNAALGSAAAGCVDALGAHVLRQCVVEDTGRFMSEAMAAIADLEDSGGSAVPAAGEKSDQFIGRCYVAYRRAITAHLPGGPTATTGYEARNDAADALQRQLQVHEPDAVRLWSHVRRLTMDGQQQTLRALGITFDCCDYESTEDQHVQEFIDRGLDLGVFVRNEQDEVVFPRKSARDVRLVNRVGLAEENSRLLSLIWRLLSGWPGQAIHVVIAGGEWRGAMLSYPSMMSMLGIEGHVDSYAQAFYGMVTKDGRKMSSSDGSGVLVDSFLAELAADPEVQEISGSSGGRIEPVHLAATIIKSFLLSGPRAEPMEFDVDRLRDRGRSAGWTLAEAWALVAQRDPVEPIAPSASCRRLLVDALENVSFQHAVDRAARLARALLHGEGSDQTRADFVTLMEALTLVPRASRLDFATAPALADLQAPAWVPG